MKQRERFEQEQNLANSYLPKALVSHSGGHVVVRFDSIAGHGQPYYLSKSDARRLILQLQQAADGATYKPETGR